MDLEASKEQIEAELPKAREAAKTPSQLEISVREVKTLIADKTTDPDLVKCLYQNSIAPLVSEKCKRQNYNLDPKKMSDLKYVLEARYQNATNEQASEQMTDVTNYLYYAFGKDKPFYSIVISKAPDGQYHPWTND